MDQIKKIRLDDGTTLVKVNERILYMTRNNIQYEVISNEIYLETLGAWKVKTELLVKQADGTFLRYQGLAIAGKDSLDPIARLNPLETAQTRSVGRALGFYGVGIEESIASFDEVHPQSLTGKPTQETTDKKDISQQQKIALKLDHISEPNSESTFGKISFKPDKQAVEHIAKLITKEDEPIDKTTEAVKEEATTEKEPVPPVKEEVIVFTRNVEEVEKEEIDFKSKIFTERELSDMGTNETIMAIAKEKGIEVEKIEGRKTNKRIRLLILASQGEKPSQEEITIVEKAEQPDQHGGTMEHNFETTGNKYGIAIPDFAGEEGRDFFQQLQPMLMMIESVGINEKFQNQFKKSDFVNAYGDWENFLRTGLVSEINTLFGEIQ